jgi:hypothetical protein
MTHILDQQLVSTWGTLLDERRMPGGEICQCGDPEAIAGQQLVDVERVVGQFPGKHACTGDERKAMDFILFCHSGWEEGQGRGRI